MCYKDRSIGVGELHRSGIDVDRLESECNRVGPSTRFNYQAVILKGVSNPPTVRVER